MSRLVSIDPGVKNFGVAVWEDGVLQHAFLAPTDLRKLACSLPSTHELVIEKMQVYRGSVAKSLIDLSLVSGRFIGIMEYMYGAEITYYLPAEWKKQAPKGVIHDRLNGALSVYEIECIELPKSKKLRLDVLDAVAIGLAHFRKTGVRVGKCFAK